MNSNMNYLQGQRVLLVAPNFFSYASVISQAVVRAGGLCHYIDERPGNDFITKGLIRINAKLIGAKIYKYYDVMIENSRKYGPFDFTIIISPEALNENVLSRIKSVFPQSKYILFMWDSIKNKTGTNNKKILHCFDSIYSFDRNDCIEYPGLKFRPLFFDDAETKTKETKFEYEYDLAFIGTIHSDRYAICNRAKKAAEEMGLSAYFYMYINEKQLFWISKIKNKDMRTASEDEFFYYPLPKSETARIFSRSRTILDIHHPGQIGLTMRSIESLGARRKLITTNSEIKTYDFYRDANIACISRNSFFVDKSFFTSPYQDLPEDLYYKYSVDGWLREITGNSF
jgi:hypothetical protein